jgi:hypothetical protein
MPAEKFENPALDYLSPVASVVAYKTITVFPFETETTVVHYV